MIAELLVPYAPFGRSKYSPVEVQGYLCLWNKWCTNLVQSYVLIVFILCLMFYVSTDIYVF